MSKQPFLGLSSVIANIASRKHRAAIARSELRAPGVESPRAVYLAACEEIAREFAPEGFRYTKSGPHFTRSGPLFTNRISFQSSHNNIPGEHVALRLAGAVTSPALKEWRSRQGVSYRSDDWVAGGLAHLFGTGPASLQWDLACELDRVATIGDIKRFVRDVMLAYFARFSEVRAVISQLSETGIPAMELASSVEFALCFGSRADAQRILDRLAIARPDLVQPAAQAVVQLRKAGIPKYFVTDYADQVALMVVAHDLSWQAA